MTRLQGLKVLVLTNFKHDGKWSLPRIASARVRQFDLLGPVLSPRASGLGAFLNRLSVRCSEFYVPILALFKRNQYDVVVTWTSRLGVVYGALNRLFRSERAGRHLTHDFHIDLRRNDLAYRCRLALLRFALPGMDFCFCTSTREERIYADLFSLSADRFRFLPMGYPAYFDHPPLPRKNFIFSYGNSARDFSMLIEAAQGLDIPLVILSQQFRPQRPLPPNVTLIRSRVSQHELTELIRSARFIVLPLLHFDFSVGQRALTEVMSLGCPLIMTANMATVEYARQGRSALFFDAGDLTGLSAQMRYLVEHPEIATQLGEEARRQAREHAGRNAAVFLEVLELFADQPSATPANA